MKRHAKSLSVILAAMLLCSSCVGSFALFNKEVGWTNTLTKSKFLNELVFLILSPVHVVCGVADVLIFNTVEFWSGSNPIAKNVGKTRQVMGQDGRYYAVKTLEDGYEITKPDGEMLRFVYDKATDSWAQISNGEVRELFRFNQDGTVKVTLPSGDKMDVAANDAGLFSVREAVNGGTYWACR